MLLGTFIPWHSSSVDELRSLVAFKGAKGMDICMVWFGGGAAGLEWCVGLGTPAG